MKTLHKLVLSADLFAHPVKLTFSQRGYKYRSSCGGIMSIFFIALIASYLGLLMDRLVKKDYVSRTNTILAENDEEQISFNFEES